MNLYPFESNQSGLNAFVKPVWVKSKKNQCPMALFTVDGIQTDFQAYDVIVVLGYA